MKPNTATSPKSCQDLPDAISSNHAANLFTLNGKEIVPVEMSTFCTVDFSDKKYSEAILYSTELTACAVVIIKNKNKESGKFDNVVTMAHFYPTNALETELTKKI